MSNHDIVQVLCHAFQKGEIDGTELKEALRELGLPEITIKFLFDAELVRKAKRNADRKRTDNRLRR